MEAAISRSNGPLSAASLRPHLVRCGYQDDLLHSNYTFAFTDSALRKADLAAFAQYPLDVRSACIGVVEASGPNVEHTVASYYELGAPIIFVCNGSLQRWRQTPDRSRPVLAETIPADNVARYFDQHRSDFAPREVFRWKTFGRVKRDPRQLDFVDAGLLPAVEGEVGDRLTKRVEEAVEELSGVFRRPLDKLSAEQRAWILESTFFLLAGKLLRDKEVTGFKNLSLDNVEDVFRRVSKHYGSEHPPLIGSDRQRRSLIRAGEHFNKFRYLGHITTDTLADVYEGALVDAEHRKALGTHSTPSYIVDWIVWHLMPWIEEMDPEERHVFEPACGHAPFLVSAMRLLRFLMPDDTSPQQAHAYLKQHLHGLDTDDRAREVARLSLTLADVPNPNGWDLQLGDMFEPAILRIAVSKSHILLCNPPFEEFDPKERAERRNKSAAPTHASKAAELLYRILPCLPDGAVFGIVLPQAILQRPSRNAVKLRERLLSDFQISEICLLSDKFFRYADHESALVLGRRTRSRALLVSRFTCRKVREDDAANFARTYRATTESEVAQADLLESPMKDLWVPDLPEVWQWCEPLPRLSEMAIVARGLEFRGKNLPVGAFTIGQDLPTLKHGLKIQKGFARVHRADRIDGSPEELYMNLAPDVIRVRCGGAEVGYPQILLSHIRVSRGPWRWKGFMDPRGHAFESCYLAVRPHKRDLPLEYLWAILNSPIANAFLYCHTMKRQNSKGLVERIPVPRATPSTVRRIVEHAMAYLSESRKPVPDSAGAGSLFARAQSTESMDPERVRMLLLRLDAEVLRLYGLPAVYERVLLDAFTGYSRPGLPPRVVFDRYYPKEFTECVPLHVFLSDAYAKRRASTGAAFMTDAERQRLDELTSMKVRRELEPDEQRELDQLRSATTADAYVSAGRAPADQAARHEKAEHDADQRLGRLADEIIGGQLRNGKRGHQA